METYVLIPSELSLVPVTRDQGTEPSRKASLPSSAGSPASAWLLPPATSSPIGASASSFNNVSTLVFQRGLIEGDGGARVYSNQRLPRGKRFLPFEGTVRIDKLDIFPYLDDDDIRHCFGSYDEIQELSKWKYRQCNWVRFLRYTSVFNGEVNLLGTLVKGEPVYETVRLVPPDTELVAYFEDPEAIQRNHRGAHSGESGSFEWSAGPEWILNRRFVISQYRHTMGIILEATPLDLSQSLLNSKVKALRTEFRRTTSTLEDRLPTITTTAPVEKFKKDTQGNYRDIGSCLTQPKRGKERTLLPCEVCGKAFDRPSLLRRHMRTHTGEKPHVCDVCGKGFSTSSSLNTHRRIHSGEKPHQCPVCGKRFTASSNLYYHRMTHSKEKPHKCELCSKSFPTPGDLKSHMYVHNGSWPFKCHICSRGFSKQTNLKNHLFLHTGDKPHVCLYCQKRFALACNLRAHLKTHEGEQLEQCAKCLKSSPVASGLLVHGYCHSCYQSGNGLAMTTVAPPVEAAKRKDRVEALSGRTSLPVKREEGSLGQLRRQIPGFQINRVNKVFEEVSSPLSPSPATSLSSHGSPQQVQREEEETEEEEEEEEEEREEVELEEETRRQFVLGVLDQVMLRYEQAGALIAKSLELNRNGDSLLEHGVATSS